MKNVQSGNPVEIALSSESRSLERLSPLCPNPRGCHPRFDQRSRSVMKPNMICMAILAATFWLPMSAIAAPIDPTQFNFTFTLDPSSAPAVPSGSFMIELSTFTFSNFIVTWAAIPFNLTAAANGGPNIVPGTNGTGCAGEGQNTVFAFYMLSTNLGGCAAKFVWTASNEADEDGTGLNLGVFTFEAITSQGADEIRSATFTNFATNFAAEGSWTINPVANQTPEPSTISLTLVGLGALVRKCRFLADRKAT
jgi:hypothetical protein